MLYYFDLNEMICEQVVRLGQDPSRFFLKNVLYDFCRFEFLDQRQRIVESSFDQVFLLRIQTDVF